MAVDTDYKRQSALLFQQPSVPLPDGSVAERDRAQLSQLYAGITGAAPSPAVVGTYTLHELMRVVLMRSDDDGVTWYPDTQAGRGA